MELLRRLWDCVRHPREGFARAAAGQPGLGAALGRMLLLRVPVALLAYTLAVVQVVRGYAEVKDLGGAAWRVALPLIARISPDLDLRELKAFLAQLPPTPSLPPLLAWGLLVAPVGILGIWLHDAAWDHGCLWVLGGLKARKGFRTTLVAEAEALSAGVFGAAASLLGQLPWVGWVLGPPLALVGIWFWVLRGFSLAAFHGAPVWKGVVATLLHALLAGCCVAGLLGLLAVLIFVPVG